MRAGNRAWAVVGFAFLGLLGGVPNGRAADWPQWRYDPGRTADSPQELPAELRLQWVRELPRPRPAWPIQGQLMFDLSYEPVVMGKTIFVPSMVSDRVTAYDTETGAERWRFYTDGPVRFAPVAWEGKLYFVSDDSHLYCLDARTGKLLWKFHGAPAGHKVLGNGRLISAWPARGGPVLVDGTIYFTAGIWPFMGIFVYAVDAQTGQPVWTNEDVDILIAKIDHGGLGIVGVSPQGYLVAMKDRLLVPCGRTLPACFDRKSGKLVKYVQEHGYRQQVGDCFVSAAGPHVMVGYIPYELEKDGHLIPVVSGIVTSGWKMPWETVINRSFKFGVSRPLLTRETLYVGGRNRLTAYDLKNARGTLTSLGNKSPDRPPYYRNTYRKSTFPRLWELTVGDEHRRYSVQIHAKAGQRLLVGAANEVMTAALPKAGGKPTITWKAEIQGTPSSMIAADGKLFVVTRQGRLYCFGGKGGRAKEYQLREPPEPTPAASTARQVIKATGVSKGLCLIWGLGSGKLVEELAACPKLQVIAVDKNPSKVARLRRKLDARGLYGEKVALHAGDPTDFGFPPYLANLIVSEDPAGAGLDSGKAFAQAVFRCLRPYGGVACLAIPRDQQVGFDRQVRGSKLAGAEVKRAGNFALLLRTGLLPGAADWSHKFADAANTLVSQDGLVKPPFGVLWFGEADRTRNVFASRTTPHVVGGRIFGFGNKDLSAVDVYTGRLLWRKRPVWKLKPPSRRRVKSGKWANWYNRYPGMKIYVTGGDSMCVAYGPTCKLLDAASGEEMQEFVFAGDLLHMKLAEGVLFACVMGRTAEGGGAGKPARSAQQSEDVPKRAMLRHSADATRSGIMAVELKSGKALWSLDAGLPLDVAVGGGKLFALLRAVPQKPTPRGRRPTPDLLIALDARTGTEVWRDTQEPFGSLSYSARGDILLQAGNERRVLARRAKDGTVVWDKPRILTKHRAVNFTGPALMVREDTFITQAGVAYSLRTGEQVLEQETLTGRPRPRLYAQEGGGCNIKIGGKNLLAFRASTGSYIDLLNYSGKSSLTGFRSGCVNSLLPGGGVLNAPSYALHCGCNYPVFTSLALAHMPEMETWSNPCPELKRISAFRRARGRRYDHVGPIRQVGINFGAPGDRRAENGTLWLRYPPLAPRPHIKLPVRTEPGKPEWFRRHSLRMQSGPLKWVAASGGQGLRTVAVTLDEQGKQTRAFTVRLYFAEPEEIKPGERVFSVSLQGRAVLNDFDIVREAGGIRRGLVKKFKGIKIAKDLQITFKARKGVPLLCGIEAIDEK